MEIDLQKTFTWKIENFSGRKFPITSTVFSSGGCECYVLIRPKGDGFEDYLSLYLCVGNPKSLQPGWKRRASLHFIVLNQSGKEVHRTSERYGLFGPEIPGWGFRTALPLTKLQDRELLENNTLFIEVYIKVTEVVHEGDETRKDMLDFKGFNVLSSQIASVSPIFAKYPKFADDIKPTSKAVKTVYLKILLGLIKTVNKPPEIFSETELIKAYSSLIDLMEVGFRVKWLKSKLDEISLARKKKVDADAARVQELEGKVKNQVELDKEKTKSHVEPKMLSFKDYASPLQEEGFLENNKLIIRVEVKVAEEGYLTGKEMFEIKGFEVPSSQVISVSQLFMKHPDIATGFKLNGKGLKTAYMSLLLSLIETLRRPPLSFSDIELSKANSTLRELTEAGFKLDWLKKKLEEVSLKRKNAVDDGSRVKQVEERIKILKVDIVGTQR
nr:hypothetical protein [Arabidopsis thaliana]